MFKNVASQKLTVFAFDATTNLPKTGDAANITAYYDLDDAGVTVLTDASATEKDSTNAKGYYIFDLAQAETNGNKILFSAKSTTSNIVVIAVPAVVYTLPNRFTTLVIDAAGLADANAVKLGPTGSGVALPAALGSNLNTIFNTDYATVYDTTNKGFNVAKVNGTGQTAKDLGAINVTNLNTLSGHDPGSTLASTTNITAGVITTVTNLTNLPSAPTDWLNSTALAASAVTEIWAGSTAPSASTIASAVLDIDMTAHQTQGTLGQAIGDPGGVDSDTIWNSLNTIYDNAYDGVTARILGNTTHVNGTIASTILTTPVAAIKTKTDQLTFTVANQIDSNVLDWKGATAPAMTGDAFARLGAPAGASISADVAGVPAALLGLTSGVETGVTLKQAIRAIAAACAGKRSNSGTSSEQFDAIGNGGTARIVGNMDGSGDGTPTLTL